jgi:polysaccharide biosynthesis protein PslH
MRLLFLTPQLPYPPRQGTTIRNWGLISQLALRHTISLLTFGGSDAVPDALRARCEHVVVVPSPRRATARRVIDLALGRADLARRLWAPAFQQALADWLARERFDGVQVEGLELAAYLPTIRSHGLPVVYDAHNAEHVIQERALATDRGRGGRVLAALYSSLQLPRLRALERAVCRSVDGLSVVSAEDAAALRALAPNTQPVVVANGILLSDYGAPAPVAGGHGRVVFTGKMDYRPNVDAVTWFAGEIWPRVRAKTPDATFWIVGQAPTAAVRALDGRDGVHVTGAVDDTRPYIAGAQAYVAPLRMGGGTRFKILEAFALRRPVISTHIGAEGFPLQNGREALLVDTPQAFAEAVGSVLEDAALAQRLGTNGRALVAAHYDWAVIAPRLDDLWQRVLARRA